MYFDPNDFHTSQLIEVETQNAQLIGDLILIATLRPKLTKEPNNRYCFSLGKDKVIAGYGETVHRAMLDFNNKFYNQKA